MTFASLSIPAKAPMTASTLTLVPTTSSPVAMASAHVPLLIPQMPSPQALLPWLERMSAARHYSNFGPLVDMLETTFAQQFGLSKSQVTTVSNATQGLELALQALDLPPRSQVLLPAFTFVATATAVLRAGHVPVLADVDADTWLLTPDIALDACSRTPVDAVMPVATFGMPHDMRAWQRFENETGLPVVLDAAAAYGSQWMQDAEGTMVFSLHATKSLPAGEGGLVVSTRPGLAARVRQMSNFGINLNPEVPLPVGTLASMGTNAKMSEYHAAVALASLETWESHAQQRVELHAKMRRALEAAVPGGLRWQASGPAGASRAPTLLCLRTASASERQALEHACMQAGIGTRRWYQPLLCTMKTLAPECTILSTPQADAIAQDLIGLPFFCGMTEWQLEHVVNVVTKTLA